jgi:hypothetical protein
LCDDQKSLAGANRFVRDERRGAEMLLSDEMHARAGGADGGGRWAGALPLQIQSLSRWVKCRRRAQVSA